MRSVTFTTPERSLEGAFGKKRKEKKLEMFLNKGLKLLTFFSESLHILSPITCKTFFFFFLAMLDHKVLLCECNGLTC